MNRMWVKFIFSNLNPNNIKAIYEFYVSSYRDNILKMFCYSHIAICLTFGLLGSLGAFDGLLGSAHLLSKPSTIDGMWHTVNF